MIGSYSMFTINIIFSALILSAALFYRYIYPKKKLNLFSLLLIICILPILSILRTGAYESGDFNIHIRRSMEFYTLLTQGNLIPTWAGDLNATYGYPLFAFNYILPYYVISLFHAIGFSFIASLKIFIGASIFLSGVFMYLFSKNHFKNNLAAFTASVFYVFNPYHLISAHFKITIGELLIFTLIPVVFYFLDKYLDYRKLSHFLLTGLALGFLILSHVFVAVSLIPVIVFYLIFKTKDLQKSIILSMGIVLISMLVSAFQWLAPIIFRPYLLTAATPSIFNLPYFPSVSDLLYSPWRFGFLFQGPSGEISFLLGYAQILILLTAILLYLKEKIKKQYRNMVLLWTSLILITIFFITPYSIFIWERFPLIANVGSQRLLIIIAFAISLLAGYVSLNINRKWVVYGIVIFAIGTTILNWGHRRVIPEINDAALGKGISLGTTWGDTHFYALTKWVNPKQPWFSIIPSSNIDVVKGNATIKNIHRSSTLHSYRILADNSILIRENTLYFPGWEVLGNDKPISIGPDKNGLITFELPKGETALTVRYKDILPFAISKAISIGSVFLILVYLIIFSLRKSHLSSKVLGKG